MEQIRIKVPEGYYEVRERIRTLLAGEKPRIIAAIDGRCGSGKTTLAAWLMEQFDGNLFHMDDFYLRSEQRTPERLAETGGNVDYERFRKEVAVPLAAAAVPPAPAHLPEHWACHPLLQLRSRPRRE